MKKTYIPLYFLVFSLVVASSLFAKTEILFSPDDKPTKRLLTLINETQKKIHAAVYMITDKRISTALINAKNRGVDVQVITDTITIDSVYGKAKMLHESGVPVYVYDGKKKPMTKVRTTEKAFIPNYAPLMHNKFAILDDTTWTGSFNWTRSAGQRNQENVVILNEQDACEKYEQQFEKLKSKSILHVEKRSVPSTPSRIQAKAFLQKVIRKLKDVIRK